MSEYIGSRISLISKSDIKYIGTLHEINSDSHTVALENVTSYGTEGRKGDPAEEIPGSDQVYPYIVFRGSDVKELTIVAPPGAPKEQQPPPKVPNDPAILGSARPAPPPQQQNQQQPPFPQQQQPPYPQQQPPFGYPGPPPNQYQGQPPGQFQGQPRFQGPGGPHGFPGSPGAVPGYGFGPPPPPPGYGRGYGPWMGPPPGPPGQFQPPPPGHYQGQQMPIGPPGPMNQRPSSQTQQQTQQPPIGSKQGTPQPPPSNIQAPPQPSQQTQPKPVEMSATPNPPAEASAGPPPPIATKPSVTEATKPSDTTRAQQQQQPTRGVPKTNTRVAVPLPVQKQPTPNTIPPTTTITGNKQEPPSITDATQAATAAVQAAMAKLGPVNSQGRGQTHDATDNLTQKVNQMRVHDGQYRGRSSRGRGSYPQRGGRRESAQKQVEVPKEDYDFESANAKFNKQDLVKDAIASGSPIGSPTNGETADTVAATNGHHVDGTNDDVEIPPAAADKTSMYDKKSSFFDNISSDLKDRVELDSGIGRTMRAQERTKNMETFGQSSVDRGGGGYRGRGRSRGGYRGYRARGA